LFGLGAPRPSAPDDRAPPRAPDGAVVWAVGDIHGQDDLFACLSDLIQADLRSAGAGRGSAVLLGDYIDRGVGARAVIERILEMGRGLELHGAALVALRGNHEEMLLRFLDSPALGPAWMELGGRETLLGYGVEPPPPTTEQTAWARTAAALAEALPPAHRAFLDSLPLHHIEGDYLFVHAGLRPGVALPDQRPDDLMWIRDAFLQDSRPTERLVIHGHTPEPEVWLDRRRLGLDTGAYATGRLSAVRLKADRILLFQARRHPDGVRVETRPLTV
jgi:serine/threonine protein phosphatase 1